MFYKINVTQKHHSDYNYEIHILKREIYMIKHPFNFIICGGSQRDYNGYTHVFRGRATQRN